MIISIKSYRFIAAAIVLSMLALSHPALAQDDARETMAKAKDLMYESNLTDAHKLFREAFSKAEGRVREEALYWAARCSYKMDAYERAREEIELFREAFSRSNSSWADDINALMVDVNRALGKSGDVEAMLMAQTVAMEATEKSVVEVEMDLRDLERKVEREVRAYSNAPRARIRGMATFSDEDCNDPDGRKEAALNALIHVEEERALEIVKKFLATDPCDKLKVKAFFVLSQHDSEESLNLLVKYAKEDDNIEVRKQALFWLGEFDDERAVDIMISMYDDVQDLPTKKNIIFNLSQMDDERATEKLLQVARTEKDTEVLRAAIHWIGQVDDEEKVITALKGIYANAGDDLEVRKAIVFSLHQMDDDDAYDVLFELAKNEPNRELRKNAIFWLSNSDDDEGTDRLVQLFKQESDMEIKSHILFSLGNRDEVDRVIDQLEAFYKETDDVELRKKIIFTLHRISDDEDEVVIDLMINLLEAETNPELKENLRFWLSQSDHPKAREYLLQGIEEQLIGS